MNFVTIPELASLARISRQAMQKAVSNFSNTAWRGARLKVTQAKGQGGKSGKQYLVAVDSLPLELQEAYWASQNTLEEPSKAINTDGVAKKTVWFVEVFADALASPKGTQARGAEMRALIGKNVIDWEGNPRKLTKKTVYTWMQKYEHEGMAALARKQNGSKGKKRVHWSKKFDDFMRRHSVGDDQISVIAESTHEYILLASPKRVKNQR